MTGKIHWRCFHCGDAFTKAQERWAREHFGRDEGELPVCQMRLPGEHHLLAALRSAQDELARYRAEDTDLMRAIYSQSADHAAALRREEERGYNKGVADVRRELLDAERIAIADKARAWAAHYPEASDGRNTFVLFAEWVEARPLGNSEARNAAEGAPLPDVATAPGGHHES